MRRKLLIAVLAFGTVAGYASAFRHARGCHYERRQHFERHVAKVCIDAAKNEK